MESEEQYGGEVLDRRVQVLFEQEILHQWDFTVSSVNLLNQSIQKLVDGDMSGMDPLWYALDAALGSLGNISKIFFPTRTAPKATVRRCTLMRAAFGVPEDARLGNRRLRDSFEHFDERIDKWDRQSERHQFLDRSVGEKRLIGGADSGDYMRWFDYTTSVISLMGDDLGLRALLSEVDALIPKVKASFEAHRAGPSAQAGNGDSEEPSE